MTYLDNILLWTMVWVVAWPGLHAVALAQQDLRLDTIYLDWSTTSEAVEVTVCFTDSIDTLSDQSSYELLLGSEDGGIWRQQQVAKRTNQQKCFAGVTLGRNYEAKILSVSVETRDSSGQKIIAEAEQFIFDPEVKQLTPTSFLVSWPNPGGHAFTIRQKGNPHPLVTSLTCTTCTYYLTSQEEEEVMLSVETESTAPLRVVSFIPLKRTGYLPQLEVLELREVLREEDDPSGRNHSIKVVLAQYQFGLVDAVSWSLSFVSSLTGSPTTVVYTAPCQHENQTGQGEILFEGEVVKAELIILTADDAEGTALAVYLKEIRIKNMGTRVAWVGRSASDPKAYLRVDTGQMTIVEVVNDLVCREEESPCYFGQSDEKPLPKAVSRCHNLTASDGSSLLQCDDVVGLQRDMTDEPHLLLRDLQALEVTQVSVDPLLEVVMVRPVDGSVLEELVCTGTKEDGTACAVTTDLTGEEKIHFMLVLLDGDGYVTESRIVPFEVYKIEAQRLREDAALVTWEDGSPDKYVASVSATGTQVEVSCPLLVGENGARVCQAHLIDPQIAEAPPTVILVRKVSEDNTVALTTTLTDISPEPCEVSRMTRMVDGAVSGPFTRLRVETALEGIVSAGLAKLTGSKTTAAFTEGYYEGNASRADGGYVFEFSEDVLRAEESSEFLALGYKDDGHIGMVGAAYVTPEDVEASVAWVGSSEGLVRVVTTTDSELTINDNSGWTCNEERSPCYYLPEEPAPLDRISLCLTLDNDAPGESKSVLQCLQCNVVPFQGMSSASLLLSDHTNLQINTSPLPGDTVALEVEVFGDSLNLSRRCDPPSPCLLHFDSFPLASQVLLVGVGNDEVVVESTLIPFQDLDVAIAQLTHDILEVWWSSPEPETYMATIQPSAPSSGHERAAARLRDGEDVAATEVTCSPDTLKCVAHFMSLEEGTYTAVVRREGRDDAAVARSSEVDSSFTPPAASNITRVTRVDDAVSRVTFEAALDDGVGVRLSVVQEDWQERREVSSEVGHLVSGSTTTYQFSHEEPVFAAGIQTKFLLVARQEEDLVSLGQAYLTLLDMDDDVAWVGADPEEKSASLRADSLSVPDSPLENEVCLEESDVCYYLEVGGQLQRVEMCQEVKNSAPGGSDDVEQCDQEIAGFTVFSTLPEVKVKGERLEVSLEASGNTLEVLAYDPNNASVVFSSNPRRCDFNESAVCTQTIKVPRGKSLVKVLIVAIGDNKSVNQSAVILKEISHPSSDWVIIVSVFCSVFGFAFIVFVVVISLKKAAVTRPIASEESGNDGRSSRGRQWAWNSWEESPPEPQRPLRQETSRRHLQELQSAPVGYDEWGSRPLGRLPVVTLRPTPRQPYNASSSSYQERTRF